MRVGKILGFATGLFIGYKTRDYFIYPYPLRVDDLQINFEEFEKETDKMEKELKKKIKKMEKRLDQVQGIYMAKKHRQY